MLHTLYAPHYAAYFIRAPLCFILYTRPIMRYTLYAPYLEDVGVVPVPGAREVRVPAYVHVYVRNINDKSTRVPRGAHTCMCTQVYVRLHEV